MAPRLRHLLRELVLSLVFGSLVLIVVMLVPGPVHLPRLAARPEATFARAT
jgi:hypothetical protein